MPSGSQLTLAYLRRTKMNNTFTWEVYQPFNIGLENIFHRLDAMSGHNTNYPPYNIVKNDSANYEIEIALAGFKAEEIEISTEQNILKVTSKIEKKDTERSYLYKGLSKRSFTNTWQLGEDVKVSSVDFEDGLLTISLEKIIPEHQKKTTYTIGASEKQFLIEDK
jgi:molecular chaperone IbpA